MKKLVVLVLLAATLVLSTGRLRAEDVVGIISETKHLTDLTNNLTGKITCTVLAAPCIQLDAPGSTLNGNGNFITGNGTLGSCPSPMFPEDTIVMRGSNATLQGPVVISQPRGAGITIPTDSANVTVDLVYVTSTCFGGINVLGSNNSVTNSIVTKAFLSPGSAPAGITVFGTGNTFQGNTIASGGGSGIVFFPSAANNTFANNTILGNPGHGIFVFGGSTGNVFANNTALGHFRDAFPDVFDPNPAGANSWANTICLTSNGDGAPTCDP